MTSRELFATRSPYERLKDARRQRLLWGIGRVALAILVPAALLYGVITILEFSWASLVTMILLLIIVPVILLTRRLATAGKTNLGSYVLLASICLVVIINVVNLDGLMPIMVPSFLSLIVVAGMLLDAQGGFTFAGITMILWLGTKYVLSLGVLRQQSIGSPFDVITTLIIQALSFFFVAAMGRLTIRDLQRALDDATYDLVQVNRELEQASQLKSQFMARTSHELRTPLNSIIGFTDLALREIYGPLTSLQQDGLRRVLSNARRLLALINDILDLSKIEAGELLLFDEEFPIKRLVNTVQSTLRVLAQEKGLAFSVGISESMPSRIVGDENRVSQIMMNLIDNAIKFTEKGQVLVEIEPLGETDWQIVVTDTGQGIRAEDQETIFEEFRQVGNPSTSGDNKGTGLGLSITRHLTRLMGGTINLQSQLGVGSEFRVVLPLRVPQASQTEMAIDEE